MSKSKSIRKKVVNKPLPKNPRQQFNAHCQAIKKQQCKINELQKKQADLVAHFQQQLLPLEKQFIDTVYQKTERLLTFTSRRSLPAYQRDDLLQWIAEEISYLESYPFSEHLDISALNEKYLNAIPSIGEDLDKDELVFMREILGDEFPFVHRISDEELLDLIQHPKKFTARAEQELSTANATQQNEEFADEEFDDDDDTFFADDEYAQEQQETMALFSTSAANRMYKRLAIAFHPDREMDETTKQDKHHLMVQLAQAKKNHDIWAIINLYQEHIDPDGGFEEKDLIAINRLLAKQIKKLTSDYRQQEYSGDPITTLLWEKFGNNQTSHALDKKLNQHANNLHHLIDQEKQVIAELTSLKMLKKHLAARAQELPDDFR